jgi:multicomponent Na+:H+ antiporter subunit A
MMLATVLSLYILALLAPLVMRWCGRWTGWVLSIAPAGATFWLLAMAAGHQTASPLLESYRWLPELAVRLAFSLDGLSLLMSLLITGIGTLVVIFAGGYLPPGRDAGRFYGFLLFFMASMLGVVLADDLIALFVFWELTSISSFILIGYYHDEAKSRAAALQALVVTGGGGLAMLAGIVLIGLASGTYAVHELLGMGPLLREHALYVPIIALILAGAFTKSAQFPFHFWLPGAMEAPAPVSAYLHAATMVKAGIYLMARLTPALGGTPAWQGALVAAGAATVIAGTVLSLGQNDMKRLLAYSTVTSLGILTLLLGLGTAYAVGAAVVFLLAHALYKGSLFLVTGAVDHSAGDRRVDRLSGLRQVMPSLAIAAGVAAVSMAGLPPLLGFIGKEALLQSAIDAPYAVVAMSLTVVASAVLVGVAFQVGLRPFLGREAKVQRHQTGASQHQPVQAMQAHDASPAHSANAGHGAGAGHGAAAAHGAAGGHGHGEHGLHAPSLSLVLPPAVLAVLGLLLGLVPAVASPLAAAATDAIFGAPAHLHLSLWHGFTLALALSVVALGAGVGLYLTWDRVRSAGLRLSPMAKAGPAKLYELLMKGIVKFAKTQTRALQTGYLRLYMLLMVVTTVCIVGGLISGVTIDIPEDWHDIQLHEAVLAVLAIVAAIATIRSQSWLGAVAAMGVVGFSVATIFALYGAPDLAMTQFLIEALTVILFVLILYHLPRLAPFAAGHFKFPRALMAIAAGGMMTLLVLAANSVPPSREVSTYYANHAKTEAHGRNIVNVILVDFRGIDTFGEITVLAIAGLGVYALVKTRRVRRRDP